MRLRRFLPVLLGVSSLCVSVGCGQAVPPSVTPMKEVTPAPSASADPVAGPDPFATAAPVAPAAKPAVPRADVELTASPSIVPVAKEQEIFVRVRVKGLSPEEKQRPALNVALVVDTSGSMDGAPIERARDACATLVDSMSDGDTLSIVTFGSKPQVIVAAGPVSVEWKKAAKKAIAEIRAEGTTDMAGGLRFGLDQARSKLSATGINRLVLMGDGVPNDSAQVLALADQAKGLGIPVTAFGLGADFDEALMTSLAQRSGGAYHFIDDASRVAQVFKDEISRMERVVAK